MMLWQCDIVLCVNLEQEVFGWRKLLFQEMLGTQILEFAGSWRYFALLK